MTDQAESRPGPSAPPDPDTAPPDLDAALRAADPAIWRGGTGDTVIGAAGGSTDLFVDPASGGEFLNAPRVLASAAALDFRFSARVAVDFTATYDAGALLLWVDERTWAKLCFEFSPQGQPMVVSVVTRGVSDDANFIPVDAGSVSLRISRTGPSYAFHASTDGLRWQLVRHFRLGDRGGPARVGLAVQSPTGQGCTAAFDRIRWSAGGLTDLRDGT